jgi:subtilisin family serine protease
MTRSTQSWPLRTAVLAVAAVLVAQTPPIIGQRAESKLATVLADLVRVVPQDTSAAGEPGVARPLAASALPSSVRDAAQGRQLRIDDDGTVQVYILMQQVTDDRLRQLAAAGVTVEIADVPGRRVQARVPAARLQRLASFAFVDFVRPPTYARPHTGGVVTEGDQIHAADVARAQFGVNGSGVRVGVISDGIRGIFAPKCDGQCAAAADGPIASRDLPQATGTRNAKGLLTSVTGSITAQSFRPDGDLEEKRSLFNTCGFPGAGAEGTALLEVVHDLAPGAQLSFANASTSLEFNQAVNALASANDVVVDDLGFFGEPANGQSSVSSNTAAALNNPQNRIRTYVTSVGNAADDHYFGTYVDSRLDGRSINGVQNAGHLHLYQRINDTSDVLGLGDQPYDVLVLPTNGEVVVVLTWDDPAGRSGNNYDLYLVRESSGEAVARSTDVQRGSQDPLEFVDFVNREAEGRFRVVIQNVGDAAAPRQLNVFSFQPQCATGGPRLLADGRHERHNYNTPSRSLSAQSDAGGSPVSVISVGAICSASAMASGVFLGSRAPSESCNDRTRQTIQYYSSRGPTLDGRMKPDVSAIDGVSITGAGRFGTPFFGTSAAAPHVAGIAALALQAAPCLISGASNALSVVTARTTLRDLIVASADPIGTEVPNNTFGSGLANAFRSVQRATAVCR